MDERAVPITEHLAELRRRIGIALGAIVVGAILAYNFSEPIFGFILSPATEALAARGSKLQAIAPTEIFIAYIKCALLAGFALTLPVSFWQLWAFVAPGLYDSEKRAIFPFVVASSVLFALGAAFGHTYVFPLMFQFLNSWDNEWVTSAWTLNEVFGLTTQMILAFGVIFELPIFVLFLSLSGIVTARQLFAGTRHAIVASFVIGAILTPPDVVSQVLMSVPMVLLYLVGVLVAWIFEPKPVPEENKALQKVEGAGPAS
ncbi:twin-arginine translocase subunit TatC [Myxococcota bacterium]|nr:twin-arginine translocase subunit TatC [Myxococcota bacterium]